jgi:N-acetyl-D-muramate 6-phosphate phosphatase
MANTSSSAILPTASKAILFDLDGTLLDTAPDLVATLNALLTAHHLSPLAFKAVRPFISEGVQGLLRRGFPFSEKDSRFESLREEFLDYYAKHLCDNTKWFAGIETVLENLITQKLPWGIVTNKAMVFTEKLVDHFPLLRQAHCIVSGDSVTHCKPHPEPLLYACWSLHCLPEHCVYVGDARRDVEAAQAAGMASLVATYGYLPLEDPVGTWNASGLLDTPHSLIDWLKNNQWLAV